MDQYDVILLYYCLDSACLKPRSSLVEPKQTQSRVAGAFVLILKGFYHRSANFVSGVILEIWHDSINL